MPSKIKENKGRNPHHGTKHSNKRQVPDGDVSSRDAGERAWSVERGAGRAVRRQPADKADAGNAPRRHPKLSTMEAARRRGSPRNRYAVAKVRWPLRAVLNAAEADAPCPARPTPLTTPAGYL